MNQDFEIAAVMQTAEAIHRVLRELKRTRIIGILALIECLAQAVSYLPTAKKNAVIGVIRDRFHLATAGVKDEDEDEQDI